MPGIAQSSSCGFPGFGAWAARAAFGQVRTCGRLELIDRGRGTFEVLIQFLDCQLEVLAARLQRCSLDERHRAGEDGSLFGRIAGSHGLRWSSRRTWKRHHTGPISAAGHIPIPITRVITARSQPQGNAQADQTGTQIDAATQR